MIYLSNAFCRSKYIPSIFMIISAILYLSYDINQS